jgi:hypothetical protein
LKIKKDVQGLKCNLKQVYPKSKHPNTKNTTKRIKMKYYAKTRKTQNKEDLNAYVS